NLDGTGYTRLHDFTYAEREPCGLIEGTDGMLYGTTLYGGTADAGTIFRLNRDGTGYQVIWNFGATVPADGTNPFGPPFQGSDGALYGTTFGGGSTGAGTVFKINPDGSGHTNIVDFDWDLNYTHPNYAGGHPLASLIEG